MASLYDRILGLNDFETDGGMIYMFHLKPLLDLYVAELITGATIAAHFAMTSAQTADLDQLLATMPNAQGFQRAVWVDTIYGILYMGSENSYYNTEALARAALGTD